ncbi:lytic murein transglycosylase [Quadrisphaera sp. KR29]|uniref:lytic murein transglycosylase n=1 Tax=Quadrisphaera sp. KR29 TaxID=3461391 RepID=UPI0040445F85
MTSALLTLTGCSLDGAAPADDRPAPQLTAPEQQLPPAAAGQGSEVGAPIDGLVDPTWIQETSDRSGIPPRTLAAYAGAAVHTAATDPSCRLGWNSLAAIGRIESAHGGFGGATVSDDGRVEPAITGVPLDGEAGVMAIPDTDGGELDGDPEWDRAVGPMQFIPTTWDRYAQDGNGDGRADPHQVDDAALTAAVYLCAVGDQLDEERGWSQAVMAYNRSSAYLRDVTEAAETYANMTR